jgi:hypothetical protein
LIGVGFEGGDAGGLGGLLGFGLGFGESMGPRWIRAREDADGRAAGERVVETRDVEKVTGVTGMGVVLRVLESEVGASLARVSSKRM